LQTTGIHAVAEASPLAAHPWLRWYGTIPANLSYVMDRLKRLIKPPGFGVFPAQVEAVLRNHPAVLYACVAGLPDARQARRVKAFVVLKDGQPATPAMEEELLGYCRSRLIKWSCPRSIEFRCELPKTRVGKADYRALMDGELE
jgi:acyl-CoA synthetase (AMP-forming)/AMP-acid ligase II